MNRTSRDALKIKYVAVPKLTQALFLINPNHFFPIDEKFGQFTEELLKTKFKDVKTLNRAERFQGCTSLSSSKLKIDFQTASFMKLMNFSFYRAKRT